MVHEGGAEINVEDGLVEMNGISSSWHPGRIDVDTGQLVDMVGTLRRQKDSPAFQGPALPQERKM